jgi:hypothetical protein
LNEALPFRHYTPKHRVIVWTSTHLFDHATYTVRHGLLKDMKRTGGLGWVPAMFSSGLITAEQQFWSSLNLSGMTVYDIGAFHGLLTPVQNLKLNEIKNVTVRKLGVGSRHRNA